MNNTITSNIVSNARKSPKMVLTILLPPASSSAFSKKVEMESNNLPLLTHNAIKVNIIPTVIEITRFIQLIRFCDLF